MRWLPVEADPVPAARVVARWAALHERFPGQPWFVNDERGPGWDRNVYLASSP